jgi:hypothetical protein
MMDRRKFVAMTGLAGAATLTSFASEVRGQSGGDRDYYELRQYNVKTADQKKQLLSFMKKAAIPALNRINVGPVGVFLPGEEKPEESVFPLGEGESPVYAVLRHKSLETVVTMTEKLGADEEFLAAGADLLDATKEEPAYARMQSALMMAFAGMPTVEKPTTVPQRVFQLRIYESPTIKTGQKKIEMFNVGEIEIFRKTGLNPVFFGDTVIGPRMPNLTYMLGFDSMEQQKAAWKTFVAHPDWKALKGKPEYADKKILSGITNLPLVAAECSQI